MKFLPFNPLLGILFGLWIAMYEVKTTGRGKRGLRVVEFYK